MDLASTVLQLTGATSALEIAQGHQSRVFDLLMVDGRRLVGKVVDDAVTLDVVATRAAAVAELADLDSRVCRPVPIDGSLVNVITDESGGSALLLCSDVRRRRTVRRGELRGCRADGCNAGGAAPFAGTSRSPRHPRGRGTAGGTGGRG